MALWIYADDRPQETRFYYFKKTFEAKAGDSLALRVSADTRYQLYINGNLICDGPCQGAAHLRYYETADASSALRDGENEVFVKVQYVVGPYFHIVYRGDHPALWFDGRLTSANGETVEIASDASWECLRDDSVGFQNFHGIHGSMPPCEIWSANENLVPVTVKGWFKPNTDTHGFTPWGTVEPYSTYSRPIPAMKEFEKRGLKEVKRGEGFVVYDTGEYTTAKVYFDFDAQKGDEIKITYAESVSFNQPIGVRPQGKAIRDDIDAEGARIDGMYDLIHARGGKQSFNTYWFRAFRYIKVECPETVEYSLTYAPYFYPFDKAGSFECSNEKYNKMWHISLNTLLCCTHETYVDCPYYEQGQYSMDGALEMLYTFRNSSDVKMPLKFIKDLAASQTVDGMICANYPTSVTQVIPDFTLFWVLALRDYLRYTGDVESVAPLMGVVDKALEAFEILKNADGLINPTKYWHYVDWVPGWDRGVPPKGDDEPLTVTCLMYAAALRAAGQLCSTLGKIARANEYEARAKEMIEAVNKHCYDSEAGLYLNTPTGDTYSQHTTVWAVLSGAVTGENAGKLVDTTFNSDKKVARCSFSMNYYLFRALEAADRYNYAPEVFAGWERMLDLHCTTWCENPDTPRSECHAWSSAPTYELSAMALGVYPTSDGYKTVRIKPMIENFDMDSAKGTVPTPYGVIDVAWEKKDGSFAMEITLPSNEIVAEVVLPDGKTVADVKGKAKFECEI